MSLFDGLDILSVLSDSEKNNLEIFCQKKNLYSGEKLFSELQEANAMYIVKSGNIEVSKILNGEKQVLGNVSVGGIIGEMALFGDNSKRMASAIALDNVELITILGSSIKTLANKKPELLEKIKGIINERKN